MLLAISIAARLAWTYLVPNGANFVDLHVYVGGAGTLDQPGALYDYVYADQTPDFPLPFTYPPFAAVVFYPLHLLPFGLVAFAWQLGIIAALYGVVRVSQRLLGPAATVESRCCGPPSASGSNRCAARSTTDRSTCCWCWRCCTRCTARGGGCRGLLVGLAAGVKLTPAVSGLYFVGARRWGDRGVLGGGVLRHRRRLGAGGRRRKPVTTSPNCSATPSRVGPIGTSFNQSWRGGISRILGHDAGYGPLVLAGDRGDRGAGGAGLARDRRRDGPARRDRRRAVVRPAAVADLVDASLGLADPADDLAAARTAARTAGRADSRLGLAGADAVGVPWLLSFAQPTIWVISRPWYLAWAGLIYIVATLATLGWIAASRRRSR